ncbi:VOC family protein [Agrobacterium sp. Ap1]|uniref:VOC family protein n=1 Tax=Agrobacterium sp. Ap1 TaxID=2815337 RepID=UPI001A901188|nr:VOC family protein [Agrobacterium sp. Ap1]MBO0143824.1 VOC family protein [Agrobacterium sp. Ap1]
MRMIFVNLPVADLQASTAFYTALGFNKNPDFSDDTASCMVVSEQIYVMLLTHDKFRMFINGDISDARKTKEVLNCLSASSRDEVDGFKAKALAAGGGEWKPNMEMGPMYGCSFQDLDGHVWEVMYMDMSGR